MEDAVTVLSRQHEELRRLMREVGQLPRISLDATGPDLRRLQELMAELRRCYVVHERLKDRYLWPVLRRAWPDGGVIARAAQHQKRHAEERFIKFRWLSERDALVNEVTGQILAGTEDHINLESHLLGRMRRSLPGQVLQDTGASLARRHFLVPTRAHPDMPASPWLAAIAGPVVGLADRVTEAFAFGPSGA
jgi:hypothetical protein